MIKAAAVDLFCGAGGLTYGLERAGIPVVAGIDADPDCAYPYEANTNGEFVEADIRDLTGEEIEDLYPDDCDFRTLAGCAPCQPFSDMSNGQTDDDADEWDLLDEFRRLVEFVEPTLVVMENVPQIRDHGVYGRFRSTLDGGDWPTDEGMGYNVWADVVDCTEYGVPQARERLILLASQLSTISLAPPTHDSDEGPVTVRRAFAELDLPEIEAGEWADADPLHRAAGLRGKNPERMRQAKPGGTWRDWDPELRAKCHRQASGDSYTSSYGRMEWDEPAPTITTQFYNYGSGRFGHPDWSEDPDESVDRAISLREGAVLQTFPPDYEFVEPSEDVHMNRLGRLIGNAIPVRLAKAVGGSIRRHFDRIGLEVETLETGASTDETDTRSEEVVYENIVPPFRVRKRTERAPLIAD